MDTASKKVAERRYARTIDYKQVFESESGKRVLYDMMNSHYMLRPTMNANPQEMAFMEGQRQVVLRILTALKIDMESLEQLLKESDDYATT